MTVERCAAFSQRQSRLWLSQLSKLVDNNFAVVEGDTIDVDALEGDAGKKIAFSDVLMHADGNKIEHGAPLDGATVTAEIVEHRKDKKVIAFKFRQRKGYHRTVGHQAQADARENYRNQNRRGKIEKERTSGVVPLNFDSQPFQWLTKKDKVVSRTGAIVLANGSV